VARANFLRCKEVLRNSIPHCFQFFSDLSEPNIEMVGNVLKEDPLGSDFSNDSGDIGPEMIWSFGSTLGAGDAEWLARVARNDAIHDSTPRLAVEGFNIRPNRRFVQGAVFHTRYQDLDDWNFDLHIADDSRSWNRQSEAEFETSNS